MNEHGNIFDSVKGRALLAPMLSTTDIPFRTICRESGAAMTFTEMVSAAGITRSSSRSFRNAVFADAERPIAIQLVAAKAKDVALAVSELTPLCPDAFDLNCGCPNERICDAGAGANLLEDLTRLGSVVEAAVKAARVPVSVKLRLGGSNRRHRIEDLVRTAELSGASAVIVHSRSKQTPYDVPADWDALGNAVAAVRIPVIGNGDIFSPDDAHRMFRDTGCHAVMIARGCLGSPWIFSRVGEKATATVPGTLPPRGEHISLINRHLRMIVHEYGELRAVPRVRKHALWYARFFRDWETLRRSIFTTEDIYIILKHVSSFFSNSPRLMDPTTPEGKRLETAFRERVLYWTTKDIQVEG